MVWERELFPFFSSLYQNWPKNRDNVIVIVIFNLVLNLRPLWEMTFMDVFPKKCPCAYLHNFLCTISGGLLHHRAFPLAYMILIFCHPFICRSLSSGCKRLLSWVLCLPCYLDSQAHSLVWLQHASQIIFVKTPTPAPAFLIWSVKQQGQHSVFRVDILAIFFKNKCLSAFLTFP